MSREHYFICPHCGHRSMATDRNAGFRREARGCEKCGFAYLFELLDDYYPAPNAAFFACDADGRIVDCGRGSFELTGLKTEQAIGQPISDALGLVFDDGTDHVATALESRAVFFVDEIHRLPMALEETLYPAMEDGCLPITVGQGAGARVVTLELPPFTLIGATTRVGLLSTPLRDRFGIQHRLEHYGPEDLATIVRRSARLLDVAIEESGAVAIA